MNIVVNSETIIVKVIDCGVGISDEEVNHYTELALSNKYSERGRGLLFIQKFTDKFLLERLSNGKFCVTLHFLNEKE